jgi:hypothetical protein
LKKLKNSIFFYLFLFSINSLYSQNLIKGKIINNKQESISFVSIVVKDTISSKIISYTYSNNQGDYNLEIKKRGKFVILFSALGFETKIIPIDVPQQEKRIDILLKEKTFELEEIVIKSEKSIKIKKDTIVFNVKSFLKGNEEVVEDLLKNIPGLNISSDGTIKVGNQEVEKVMVDGDDFFEKGYKILTKNMPSEPIDKIEVLKKYSNNKHLKGIEDSKKVALNLILKEDSKRVWFGNVSLGYGLTSENIYNVKGNLANFGKKNKYYFLTNLNNIGSDATGDIWNLVQPFKFNESQEIGDGEYVNNLLAINSYIPNFKGSRTNFNKAELLSLNAIFNPTKKLKIKTLAFFNWDENDFFRNSSNTFQVENTNFTNVENNILKKKKVIGFGKIEMIYDISKTKTLELVSKYNNLNENNVSNLNFNSENTIENLKTNKYLFDQKVTFTNKFEKRKVLLLKGRYINEKSPENYAINKFFYEDLFPNTNSNNAAQSNKNEMSFLGVEAQLLDRKENGNLFEIQIGNQLREDFLLSSLILKEGTDILDTPNNYRNNLNYLSNDLYFKTKFLLKLKNVSFNVKLGVHQFLNKINSNNDIKEERPFFVNPKLGFNWKINDENKINTSYSYNTTNAKILDVYDNYILTGFRSFSRGTGNFDQLNTSSITFNYQLGNWGNKFFANTFLIYNKNHDFYSTNSNIRQNYSQADKVLIRDKEFLNISSNIDRYFKIISSNIKFKVGLSNSSYKNIVNNSDLREITSRNYNYGLEIRSGFSGIFNYHIGTNWTTNKIESNFTNSFTNNTSFLDLSFVFNDKFNIDFQGERYFFGNLDKNNSTYYFADLNARYILEDNKITISLIGKNLFNTDKFKEFSISDIGNSTTEYRLLSRYLLLKMEYRF